MSIEDYIELLHEELASCLGEEYRSQENDFNESVLRKERLKFSFNISITGNSRDMKVSQTDWQANRVLAWKKLAK